MKEDMVTMGELEKQMDEMRDAYAILAKKLDDTLAELKALSIAVEKLKANVKYMQDEVI